MIQNAPRQSITLTVPYDLSDEMWERVSAIYESMPGWIGFNSVPFWFGQDNDPRYIWASVEPSGLLVSGRLDDATWAEWTASLRDRLTSVLGFEVRDADA